MLIISLLRNHKDCLIISSCGMISRVVDRDCRELGLRHLPVMGSMGCALAVGLGYALNSKDEVVVFEGDGAAMMGASAYLMYKSLWLPNLKYYILNNAQYATTGGQATRFDIKCFQETSVWSYESETAPRIKRTLSEIFNELKKEVA